MATMKMTLLEMVQNILSAMEADDVNSISDTPEGSQVAEIIKEVYFQTVADWAIPELATAYFNLEGLGDTTKPNYLQLPDDVQELYWFQYDVKDAPADPSTYSRLAYVAPEEFFDRVMSRDSTDANTTTITTTGGVPLFIETDKKPEFYTIIDDKTIITDSYDNAVDTTLQGSKTVAAGMRTPTFTLSDSFVPDLDANLFPFLLAEAKAVAFVNIEQVQNPKAEQASRTSKVRWQNQKERFKQRNQENPYTRGPNFGRQR
jgi:hypothetical protein